jgi:hypothetical protein
MWNLIMLALLRHIGGWSLILVGLLGFVLPVLPGILLLVLGIVVLGPHDPTLRRIALYIRLGLRRWSQLKQPLLRRIGWKMRHAYGATRLQLRMHLHRHQHGKSIRRVYLLLVVTGFVLATIIGISFMILHQAP